MGCRWEGQGMWHPELVEGPEVKDSRIFEAMTRPAEPYSRRIFREAMPVKAASVSPVAAKAATV